jgi:cell division protein FtsI (penicillin-binding protein 3)
MGERRLQWLVGIVVLWGAAILWNLVKLEVFHHKEYVRIAHKTQEIEVKVSAPRGPILDRSGEPLAMSVPVEKVTVNPLKLPDLPVAADLLALVLHLNRAELYGRMLDAQQNGRGYLVVKPKITFEEGQNLRALKLEWVDIDRKSERHYPGGALAAHVLGSVDFNETGSGGVEKSLNADLLGAAGSVRLLTDVKRRGVDSKVGSDARPGLPVTLTIDERLQFIAERELAAAVQAHHAQTGSVVVMNPQNGDILALASYPTYDPNIPPIAGDNPISRQNHAVSVPFEPGSVFKVITLSAALETTNLTPDSLINCHGGVLTLYGRTFHDSHYGALGLGILPMSMVLAHSSNIGAIEVGLRVGQEHMYDYVRRFGFGQRTGIQLPAESAGRLRKLPVWTSGSLPSISMGQEISVTTLQLAQAASVIANGGLLVRPRLILKKGDQTIPPATPVRVIRPETAITMRQMMEGVVLYGTGRLVAKLQGYSSAGKTGSAQIFDTFTHHYGHSYNGSFMGFSPVTNPSIVVVATVNGTHGESGFGGPTAGPVFRAVTTEALRLLDVPKDLPEQEAKSLVLVADNMDSADDLADAGAASGEPNILEDPEDDGNTPPNAPRVPNFRGMTIRAVLAEAASKGLTVLPAGSGVARLQEPVAGSILHEGERIRVRFAR